METCSLSMILHTMWLNKRHWSKKRFQVQKVTVILHMENEHAENTNDMHTNFQEYAAPAIGLGNAGDELLCSICWLNKTIGRNLMIARYKHACSFACCSQTSERRRILVFKNTTNL